MTVLLEVTEVRKVFTGRRPGLLARRRRSGRDLNGRNLRAPKRAEITAVDGVSFELERGASLGLVGESGSGKSTLALLIVGLLQPTSGSIRFEGVELTRLRRKDWRLYRKRIQIVFQDPYSSLDPRQTVRAILEEPLAIHRIGRPRERRLRALELLDAVGLAPRHLYRYPHEFSGGQRQRIGIARALALEPELLVCDEPVSALDVSIRSQILNLFQDLRERFALSYLFISHDLAVVRALCPRIAVMVLGHLVEVADRDALFTDPKHPYTRALISAVPVPDPEIERARARPHLEREIPAVLSPSSGCVFHPRCPVRIEVANERCVREIPPLLPLPESGALHPRLVACHLRFSTARDQAIGKSYSPLATGPDEDSRSGQLRRSRP